MPPYGLPATEPVQAQFFTQLREGFADASARTGEIIRDFRVAGTSVRLRFAGDALIPSIVPGLAHPSDFAADGPECEICLWDSESTGIPLAPPPRPWGDFTGRGNIWGFDSSRYLSAYQWGEGSANVMDRTTRQAVYWVPSHEHLPAWVLAAPLRSILHWWMQMSGRQLVHAAAVGQGDRAVLIPGRGGSGKSSTSIACLLGGLDFIADDYLAVAMDPEPRVYRLYSTAKLDPLSLNLYPDLLTRCRVVYQEGFDKVVLFLEDGYRDQLRESLALTLVLRPYLAGVPETTFGPVEPREIERALAAETLVHLPHAGDRTLAFLDRIAHEVPRAAIHLGTDRAHIATAIRRSLEAQTSTDVPRPRASEQSPFVSILVHFREEDREELRALAAGVEAQRYPRAELIVTADGTACAMADEVSRLLGHVRFLTFDDCVASAEAWNRGIRESFAELLVLIEPGDRFPPGALDALVTAAKVDSAATWIRGTVVCSGQGAESPSALRGALIRKSAFRDCGLFDPNPLLQGREQQDWLLRAQHDHRTGRQIEAVTLDARALRPFRLPCAPDLGALRVLRDRLRQKTPE